MKNRDDHFVERSLYGVHLFIYWFEVYLRLTSTWLEFHLKLYILEIVNICLFIQNVKNHATKMLS